MTVQRIRRPLLIVGVMLAQFVALAGPVAHAPVVHAAAPNGSSKFVPIAPFRLADSRPSEGTYGFTPINNSTLRIDITHRPGVPANATAAVVNVTMIGTTGPGYTSVYPTGTAAPSTSNVNSDAAGRVIANMAHVKIGTNGSIDLVRSSPAYIAVDLIGVYVPVTDAVAEGRLVTINSGAKRVLDTRERGYGVGANLTNQVDLTLAGVPAAATAVVVNVTAVQGAAGFWTAYTVGQSRPGTSTLNLDTNGQTRSGQAIVQLNGVNRALNVYSAKGGHLLVDVVGWFTGSGDPVSTDGLFIPTAPLRMLDTRAVRTLAPWAGSTYEFYTGNSLPQISAVAMNITATSPWDSGFVTAHPAGVVRPDSSNVNLNSWPQTIANHAIVRVSARGAALYTKAGAHMMADVAGWYLGTPVTATQPVPVNPVFNPNRAAAVYAPKIGLYLGIKSGSNLDTIANQGFAATWSDTVNVATPGNVMLFGHRTTHGGPFRYLNLMKAGDTFTLIGTDGHWYNYRVTNVKVTSPYYTTIASVATPYGMVTAQLVACSKLDGTPTSTSYRIAVTGRLISIT